MSIICIINVQLEIGKYSIDKLDLKSVVFDTIVLNHLPVSI